MQRSRPSTVLLAFLALPTASAQLAGGGMEHEGGMIEGGGSLDPHSSGSWGGSWDAHDSDVSVDEALLCGAVATQWREECTTCRYDDTACLAAALDVHECCGETGRAECSELGSLAVGSLAVGSGSWGSWGSWGDDSFAGDPCSPGVRKQNQAPPAACVLWAYFDRLFAVVGGDDARRW